MTRRLGFTTSHRMTLPSRPPRQDGLPHPSAEIPDISADLRCFFPRYATKEQVLEVLEAAIADARSEIDVRFSNARWTVVEPQDVQVGDFALHVSGKLDPRPVFAVVPERGMVRLNVLGKPTDWLPLEQYTYKRVEMIP